MCLQNTFQEVKQHSAFPHTATPAVSKPTELVRGEALTLLLKSKVLFCT